MARGERREEAKVASNTVSTEDMRRGEVAKGAEMAPTAWERVHMREERESAPRREEREISEEGVNSVDFLRARCIFLFSLLSPLSLGMGSFVFSLPSTFKLFSPLSLTSFSPLSSPRLIMEIGHFVSSLPSSLPPSASDRVFEGIKDVFPSPLPPLQTSSALSGIVIAKSNVKYRAIT